MGGSELPQIFSGDTVKVSNAIAAINGLCDEFVDSAAQVRNRWPMGLGKYLLDKLEASMTGKGVLQVDKVENKAVTSCSSMVALSVFPTRWACSLSSLPV